jgi:RIO kinase 1
MSVSDKFQYFIDRGIINEVIRVIKSGKESEIYLAVRWKKGKDIFVAGKVHLERAHRNFRREILYRSGWNIKERTSRKAVKNMTRYGQIYIQNRWVSEEWNAMRTLWKEGASVPTPIIQHYNIILMTLIGDGGEAAPKLAEVELTRDEWEDAFHQMMDNVRIMTKNFLVHGDLSAYNMLHQDGKLWVIDFPQTTDLEKNTNGADLLYRDLRNVCNFFARKGVDHDPETLFRDLLNMEYEQGKSYLEMMVLNE